MHFKQELHKFVLDIKTLLVKLSMSIRTLLYILKKYYFNMQQYCFNM